MKKLFLTGIFAFLLVMTGCKSASITGTKVDRSSGNQLKGNWVLTSVTLPQSELIKVKSFDLADSQCFEGSTWSFVPSNNKGEMALNNSSCESFSSPITWYINKDGMFVFKVLNAGVKAKKVRDGYILSIANQSAASFQLIDQISLGGRTENIVYQFQKN